MVGVMNSCGVEVSMVQTIANEKGYRLDISAGGQSGYMLMTPYEGWMFMPSMWQQEPVKMTPDQLKGAPDKLNFRRTQFVNRSMFSKIEFDDMDTLDNVPCNKLNFMMPEGAEQECYFDSRTYYLLRVDLKVEMAGVKHESTTKYSNFKKLPEVVTVAMTVGSPKGDLIYSSFEINKPVNENIFKS